DIRTENHTQLDGALIASDSGDLKLDTDTLGFSDIAGHDKEHSYYLNVGGSYGNGQQDQSQQGKGDAGVNGWSVEGHEYERDRQQIVRATVGEGEIIVRNDEQTDTDSTAGLNRDTRKASEITRDEEERTDLYVSKSSVEAVANPGKTLQAWGEALVNYDEQAKANFEQLGVLANASLNELEKLTGRTLTEGAVKSGGAEIAEQTLYGLIMSGMSLDAAKALLANQAFQEQVLANLSDIDNVFSETPDLLKTVERGLAEANLLSLPDFVILSDDEVTPGALRPEQAILGRVSDINAYIEANPDQEKAVGFVLAAAQGPKGLMMWAASQALADTPFGEQVAQYQAYLEGILGKAIAEGVEGHDMDASYENDAYLLGGGGLIGTLLVGAVGSKAGKAQDGNSSAVNHNPHSGRTDAEAGMPYEHPVKVGEGAKEAPGKTIIVDSQGNALVGDWSVTKKLTAPENAFAHWTKHSSEFPEYSNASQYVEGAQSFVSNPPANVLTKMRNGDTLLYDPSSNTFAVKTADGAPRTMFRPSDGINYWSKQ
ncbi:MAG: hypothetical protein ACK5NQ_18195, partial [Pseudomonas sp.]